MTQGTHIVLKAFTPTIESYDAGELEYENLNSVFNKYNLRSFITESGRSLLLRKANISRQELRHNFSVAAIINASYRLQRSMTPIDKMLWSYVFTSSSIKLFGQPLRQEAGRLARLELDSFKDMSRAVDCDEFMQPLFEAYEGLLLKKHRPMPSLTTKYATLLTDIKTYFEQEYADAFACFDAYPSQHVFTSHDVAAVFRQAVGRLAERDRAWADWRVTLTEATHLSVNVGKKRIVVGKHRIPIDHASIRGLFAHEVLVHAMRGVNGAKISKRMGSGTLGYLIAEEGFGVLVESAINGFVPEKIKDRYIDIALALGDQRGPMSREALYGVCYRRNFLRAMAEGVDPDLSSIEKISWQHVNRIYRGTLGNKYVGVFTKDIAYYRGFVRLARHFEAARKKGLLESRIRFSLQGKFDPTCG